MYDDTVSTTKTVYIRYIACTVSLFLNLTLIQFLTLNTHSFIISGGGANSKKVNTHPKIPEIDLDFF